MSARRQLPLDLLRRQLLEVARIKVGGVVDEHVDAAEAVDGGLHRCLGVRGAGDVQLDDQQVLRLADGPGHRVGVASSCDDRVPGGQRGPGNIDAHPTARAGNEPNFLISHLNVTSRFDQLFLIPYSLYFFLLFVWQVSCLLNL